MQLSKFKEIWQENHLRRTCSQAFESGIRTMKGLDKWEKRCALRVAEQKDILFARYQKGTMKRNKRRAEQDALFIVQQEETDLTRSDIKKEIQRKKIAKRRAAAAAKREARKMETHILADTQALLEEKEEELLAMRDAASIASEKIAFLEERMDDLLVVLKDLQGGS
ncbi:uncharacterized protein EDB93DRAFT_1110886 [Suillus bovinus]|uniref:uncharacterized protein n=1 Tax=Suillus bovinus TaxID=48563 RepID=UPI001B86C60B|nr:uncharacterized protein EDB93DRAFT_1110886 [Suillus bovinus]KAG2123259.1 hypothetical protein EDB93DRAFT_1110886 [Suillus bovinus]